MPIDPSEIYDKSLEHVKDALDGHTVPYEKLTPAIELLKPIMLSIYLERVRGKWSNVIDDPHDPDRMKKIFPEENPE